MQGFLDFFLEDNWRLPLSLFTAEGGQEETTPTPAQVQGMEGGGGAEDGLAFSLLWGICSHPPGPDFPNLLPMFLTFQGHQK